MKFREWEDFANEINEYGRYGYVKKKSMYNPFTKVNTMVMEHKTRFDEVVFVLYPDDESYDVDWNNEPYIRPRTRGEQAMDDIPKQRYEPKVDHRTREHRSDKYPEKPGTQKTNAADKKPSPPKPNKTPPPKPKPGPYQKKDDK
jgi:hypothetical protein